MLNPVRYGFQAVAIRLAAHGVIDRDRGVRIADLAWPRFLTMFARMSQLVADVAMVGLAIGPAAIAGLAFAKVYWDIANAFSLGLVGGTVNQISQRFGAGRYESLDLAAKQSLWVGLAIGLPFLLAYSLFAAPLIRLLGTGPAAVSHGTTYLQVVAIALMFNNANLVASRTLAGADDTWIAMNVRATGAFANILLNAVFIFGLGMGVAGAALGTVLAEAIVFVIFAFGFVSGSLPVVGAFPVTISPGRPYVDLDVTRQLLTITPPLMAAKLARAVARFPLFALLAVFGPTVVAAFEIGRRVRNLMRSTGNGFQLSASTVVGQELGRGDEAAADRYAGDALRLSTAIYLCVGALVFALAGPIAAGFTDDPQAIARTIPFVRVAALSFVGIGLNYTYAGILLAAGDNQWTLYGRLVGQYLLLLPFVYLGTITPYGVLAVYLGIVLETWAPAAVTAYRVHTGRWKAVSRRHRPGAPSD